MSSRESDTRRPGGGGPGRLSAEERTLVKLLSEGVGTELIGRRLGMSDRSVRRRLHGLCERLGVQSTIEVVVWAVRSGQI